MRASDGGLHDDATVTVNIADVQEQVDVEPPVETPVQSPRQSVSEPEGEDLPTSTSTAGRVAVGGIATGNIGTSGDRDWFAVELVAGRTYQIDLRGSRTNDGTLRDPYLRGIHDADGNRISGTTNDDGGESLNSRVSFTATESGTYYIAAGAYSGRGTYELEVTDTSPPDTPRQPEEGANEAPAFGQQSYAFDLAENADGSTGGVALGTVSATDPENAALSYSIAGGNAAGLFEIDASTGALSYIGSGEDYESGTTSYELTVRASDGSLHDDATVTVNIADVQEQTVTETPVQSPQQSVSEPEGEDLPTNTSTAGRVAVGGIATGEVETGGDRDWFAVDLVAGRTYRIDLRGSPTNDGTLRDPYLRGIHDADGNLIPGTRNDDGGEGYNSRVSFTATESGTYYIAAGAYSRRGTYEVEVTDTSVPQEGTNVAPAFDAMSYAFALAENADGSASGVALGTVSAIDPENASLSYSIEGGNAANLFEIDASTGALSYIGSGEDYESGTTSYELTVRASDGSLHDDVTVTVSVTDVQEQVEEPAPEEVQPVGPAIRVSDAEAHEEAGVLRFRVTLEQAATGPVTVRYATSDGTATAGADYETASGTLTFAAGETERWVEVTLIDDTVEDSGEILTLTLSGADGGHLADAAAEGTILNSETGTVSEGGTDFAANTGTRGRVVVGETATGGLEISRPQDVDWFAVTLEGGKIYRIDLEGDSLRDPSLLGVHDRSGYRLADTTDENSGDNLDARVFFQPAVDSVYYIAAGAPYHPQIPWDGTYRLSVTEIDPDDDDFAGDESTTGQVAVGGSTRGEIEHPQDIDWFAVTLEAGVAYRIDLQGTSTGGGSMVDPLIFGVYDAEGCLIPNTADLRGGFLYDARTYFQPAEGGTYYIAAAGDGEESGTYRLSVRALPDDYLASTGTTGRVEVGDSVTGRIGHATETDWFRVTLEAGQAYTIDLKGTYHGAGTLPDPILCGIFDADGNRLRDTTDDDGGNGRDARLAFTPTTTGFYYISAGGYDGHVGTYELSVEETM